MFFLNTNLGYCFKMSDIGEIGNGGMACLESIEHEVEEIYEYVITDGDDSSNISFNNLITQNSISQSSEKNITCF